LCSTKSGREIDKMNLHLKPVFDSHYIYYSEAEIVVLCKKIYIQDIDPKNFLDPKIQSNYPINDYHRMYIGEVIKTLVLEK